MQLHRPARMFAILECKHLNDWRCQAWKSADITAQAILERRHRIVGTPCDVVPAFHGRSGETDIQAGHWVAPRLGGERLQCGIQRLWHGRGCQQRTNDREAQARPTVTFVRIGWCVQKGLPVCGADGSACGSGDYKPSLRLAIGNFCVWSAPLVKCDRMPDRQRGKEDQEPHQ